MHSPDSGCLKEYNKIVIYDLMKIRQFQDISIEFVIDIGANIGIATLFSKTIFPKAKIIAIEPDPQSFECLKKNTHFVSGIYLENKGFGSGQNCEIIPRDKRFLDRYTIECENGTIPGISMKEIFNGYGISSQSKYFIKSDCEGAEKQFISDLYCENAIRNAEIFFVEIHFNSPGTPIFKTTWNTYNNWINNTFNNTHKIEYFKSNRKRGFGHYLLKKLWN